MVKHNKFKYLILLALAIVLFCFSTYLRHNSSTLFYDLSTSQYESHTLGADYAHKNKVLINTFYYLLSIFGKDYLLTAYILLIPAILLAAFSISNLITGKKISPFVTNITRKPIKSLIIVLSFALVSIVAIHFFILLNYPMITDEYSYLFQADLLTKGKLFALSPPQYQFFISDSIVCDGKWYSKYTLGWPIMLAFGKIINMDWLIGPLCGVFSLLFLYLITKKLFGTKAGFISIIFALFSPVFGLTTASYFPHASLGLAMLIFIYCILNLQRDEKLLFATGAGLAIAFAVNIRPSDGVVMGLGAIPLALFLLIKSKKKFPFLRGFISIIIFSIIGVGIIMLVNTYQTGDPFTLGYSVYNPHDKWGFGVHNHNFFSGLWNLTYSLMRLSYWTVPLLGGLCLFSFIGKKRRTEAILLSLIALAFITFNLGMFAIGMISYGTRYYYAPYLILIILASGGIITLSAMLARKKFIQGKIFMLIFLLGILLYTLVGVDSALLPLIKHRSEDVKFNHERVKNPPGLEGKTLIFLLSSQNMVNAEFTRNNWNYQAQKNLLVQFLLPEENEKLIKDFPDRKAYLEYWDPEKSDFLIIPYPTTANTAEYLMYSGINYGLQTNPIQRKKMEIAFKRAIDLAPDNYSIIRNLGFYYYQNLKLDEAIKIFSYLKNRFPQKPESSFFLGKCLIEKGNKKEGMKILEDFIRNYPDDPYTDRAIDWYIYYNKRG
jgi:hypothetical protein